MTTRWQRRKSARRRWALNAVRAKARKRMAAAPEARLEPPPRRVFRPRTPRADLRVNLARADGGRLQFSAHFYNGKLISRHFQLSPKQFGRRLGEIFELWMRP
jgi:hypothetical protein